MLALPRARPSRFDFTPPIFPWIRKPRCEDDSLYMHQSDGFNEKLLTPGKVVVVAAVQ